MSVAAKDSSATRPRSWYCDPTIPLSSTQPSTDAHDQEGNGGRVIRVRFPPSCSRHSSKGRKNMSLPTRSQCHKSSALMLDHQSPAQYVSLNIEAKRLAIAETVGSLSELRVS